MSVIDLDVPRLSAAELEFLHKTSVDFVLASPEGEPILAVEFDGLGHGFNQDGRYLQTVPVRRDENRAWKLGLKTRIADTAGFPLMVLSHDETAVLDPETGLTFVHGLVGHFLAHRHLRVREGALLTDEEHEWLEGLPRDERYEYIQDRITGEEVANELRWNPIAKLDAELTVELIHAEKGIGWGYQHLEDGSRPPECEPLGESFDAEAAARWFESRQRIGCRMWVTTSRGTVERSVWIRRVSVLKLDPIGFVNEAAGVLAKRAALRLLRAESDIPSA